MYEKSKVYKITKVMIEILFYAGILCIIGIPLIAKEIRILSGTDDSFYIPFCIILLISGVCCEYILFILKKMYKTLMSGNPFSNENTECFRQIAVLCFICAFVFFIKLFFSFTVATLVITLIFIVGTLFCLTLKDIFKQAVFYKDENDLTI